jgi:feruloyl esterase
LSPATKQLRARLNRAIDHGLDTQGRLLPARPGSLLSCTDLAAKAALPGTVYAHVESVPAGVVTMSNATVPVPAHGTHERTRQPG